MTGLPSSVRWQLLDVVGSGQLLEGADAAPSAVDWTGRFRGATPAVVRPGSVHEVAGVLEVCRRHGIAVVPQGGNTGLVGGSVPLDGEVVLSLRRLDEIGPVDAVAQQLTVGAGVTLEMVQTVAARAGLRYAVDFAARGTATIGGTVATNAGGINVLRFGATREQLLGVEAVIGTGDVVRRLGGLVKDNTGYHLPSLLCGSEGTLGIVTAARLRLVAAAPERVVALVGFSDVASAVAAVADWRRGLPSLEAAELMLADGVGLVVSQFGLPRPLSLDPPVFVLLEAAGLDDPTDAVAAAVDGVDGVLDAAVAADPARRAALWRYREEHTLAINAVGVPHKFDVTIPAGRLADAVATFPAVVRSVEPDAQVWIFGHVGDGNLHLNVTGVDPAATHLDEVVYRAVVELGGSISAEHGIGRAKARYLQLDRSTGEIDVMRAVKRALDPDGLLNPGVLFADGG